MRYHFVLGAALVLLLFAACEKKPQIVYFNSDWKVVSTRDSASYYRIANVDRDNRVEFEDHYMTGEINSSGTFLNGGVYCASCRECSCDGVFKFYYRDGWCYLTEYFKDGHYVRNEKNPCDYECGTEGPDNILVYCCKRTGEKGYGAPLHDPWFMDVKGNPDTAFGLQPDSYIPDTTLR